LVASGGKICSQHDTLAEAIAAKNQVLAEAKLSGATGVLCYVQSVPVGDPDQPRLPFGGGTP
jgi:hypothetical protein